MGSEKSSITTSSDVMMQEVSMKTVKRKIKIFFITVNCMLESDLEFSPVVSFIESMILKKNN